MAHTSSNLDLSNQTRLDIAVYLPLFHVCWSSHRTPTTLLMFTLRNSCATACISHPNQQRRAAAINDRSVGEYDVNRQQLLCSSMLAVRLSKPKYMESFPACLVTGHNPTTTKREHVRRTGFTQEEFRVRLLIYFPILLVVCSFVSVDSRCMHASFRNQKVA